MEVALWEDSFDANYEAFRVLNEQRSQKIFLAERISDDRQVAVKLEVIVRDGRIKATEQQGPSNLEHEYNVYKILRGRGVPYIHWFGIVEGCEALVMDLMGPALDELFVYCKRRFTLKTVLLLADQMLDRIEILHKAGFVHGDLTPDTFVMGIEENNTKVYLINMKWASEYVKINGRRRKHIPYKENVKFYGSPRFASLNRHLGTVASRRDDLESYAYIVLYFALGQLPWQVHENTSDGLERILEMKTSVSVETLCHGLPPQFAMVLNYCRSLKFEAQPDYLFIRNLFSDLFRALSYEDDNVFDWMSRRLARRRMNESV